MTHFDSLIFLETIGTLPCSVICQCRLTKKRLRALGSRLVSLQRPNSCDISTRRKLLFPFQRISIRTWDLCLGEGWWLGWGRCNLVFCLASSPVFPWCLFFTKFYTASEAPRLPFKLPVEKHFSAPTVVKIGMRNTFILGHFKWPPLTTASGWSLSPESPTSTNPSEASLLNTPSLSSSSIKPQYPLHRRPQFSASALHPPSPHVPSASPCRARSRCPSPPWHRFPPSHTTSRRKSASGNGEKNWLHTDTAQHSAAFPI